LSHLLYREKIPYIVTVHGMLDEYSMRQKAFKKRAFLALGGRKLFTRATTVHFTAEAERDQAQPWIPGKYLSYIQACAMDLAPYENLPGPSPALATFPQIDSRRQKILFLSRVHPKKGVDLLLQAAQLLKARGLTFDLLIAGPGEEKYVVELRQLAGKLGVSDSTHFLGMVRGDVKISLYEVADVFVLPTHQENFGLVLPEALACSTPVVTTRGTDIWRELQQAGASIVDNRPDKLADAIAELLTDEARRIRLGERGRNYVMKWLAEDQVVAGYERMYQQTLQHAGRN
jgi:glycosyltransferase involved in cell wall biosynthesis